MATVYFLWAGHLQGLPSALARLESKSAVKPGALSYRPLLIAACYPKRNVRIGTSSADLCSRSSKTLMHAIFAYLPNPYTRDVGANESTEAK